MITVGGHSLKIACFGERTNMPDLSPTACKTCRAQKLRCSRALPTCDRCDRLDKTCLYPEAPDRKLLAKARTSRAKHQRHSLSSNEYGSADESLFATDIQSSPSDHVSKIFTPRSADSREYVWYQSELVNVYFDMMWNSHILLYKPSFLGDLESGRIPNFLLLSLCAAATIFLRPGSAAAGAHAELLSNMPDLQKSGRQWAESAGTDALSGIDQPTVAHVQACNVLDLYWLSAGSPGRSLMYSRIAYSAASILNFDKLSERVDQNNQRRGDQSDPVKAELQRRCFWAVWVGAFIKADQQSLTAISRQVMELPLPTESETVATGSLNTVITLSMIKHDPQISRLQRGTAYDTFSELINLVMIWNSVGSYLEQRQIQSARKALPTFIEIDESLVHWAKHLPPKWHYTKQNLYENLIVKQRPQFVFLHCLNHQCRLVLRSSLVPEFSGLSWNDEDHVELISVSARVAFKTACNISDIASDLIALDYEFGQLPPFIGYCMYASAAIHVLFLFSRNTSLSNIARNKMTSNIRILELMKAYWRCLEPLWNRVTILYNAQVGRASSAPIVKDVAITLGFDADPDNSDLVDESVRTPRITNLSEPLADSVMKFNMSLGSKPTQTNEAHSISRQDAYQDPLTRLHDQIRFRSQAFDSNFQEHSRVPANGSHSISFPDNLGPSRISTDRFTQAGARFGAQQIPITSSFPQTTSSSIDPAMPINPPGGSMVDFLPLDFQDPSYWMDIDFSELNQTMLDLDQDADLSSWWNDIRTY